MAYTPINWQTGDTITAEKLNKMDNGWGYESTQLFSETVTTADSEGFNYGTLAYASLITADTITVTFDGTEYMCSNDGLGAYGATWSDESESYDFTTYPFSLVSISRFPSGATNRLTTQTAGAHTIAAAAKAIDMSSNFVSAVKVAAQPFVVTSGVTTYEQAINALTNGQPVYYVTSVPTAVYPVVSTYTLTNPNYEYTLCYLKIAYSTKGSVSGGAGKLVAASFDGVLVDNG